MNTCVNTWAPCVHKYTCQELARARAGSPHQLRDARELLRKKGQFIALEFHAFCDITTQVLGTITSWKSSNRKQEVTGFTMAGSVPSSAQPSLNRTHAVAPLQASSQRLPGLAPGRAAAAFPPGSPRSIFFSSPVTATPATCLAQLLK